MPLAMEGPRPLSPLEREAVKLVFDKSIDPSNISLRVVENIPPEWHGPLDIKPRSEKPRLVEIASAYGGNGNVTINRSAFTHTDALDIESDRTDKKTDAFKPGNMHYLSTLIHECTHHWQRVHGRHMDWTHNEPQMYDFTAKQLDAENVPDLLSEQHASAVQVYFLIQWQIQYKGFPVDLTSQAPNSESYMGPADRYNRIARIWHVDGKRMVERKEASDLSTDFIGWCINEIKAGGIEPRPCGWFAV